MYIKKVIKNKTTAAISGLFIIEKIKERIFLNDSPTEPFLKNNIPTEPNIEAINVNIIAKNLLIFNLLPHSYYSQRDGY